MTLMTQSWWTCQSFCELYCQFLVNCCQLSCQLSCQWSCQLSCQCPWFAKISELTQNLTFSILTPRRFQLQRSSLQKIANQNKRNGNWTSFEYLLKQKPSGEKFLVLRGFLKNQPGQFIDIKSYIIIIDFIFTLIEIHSHTFNWIHKNYFELSVNELFWLACWLRQL